VDLGHQTVRVPRYAPTGRAGFDPDAAPILEAFELDRKLAGPEGSFLIAMVGDTLEAEGIRDSDLLLVQPADGAMIADGEIAVLATGEGARVARYRRRVHGTVAGAVSVRGKVIGVIRRMRTRGAARTRGG
jgi:SOS-response transcriptional repressor LexA